MKKFRKALALLLALCMVLGLAACSSGGSNDTQPPDGNTEPANEPGGNDPAPADGVSITLAVYPIGKWNDEAVVKDFIADFNAQYPNIKVDVQYLTYENGDDIINTAIEAKTTPDIIFEGPERLIANWGAKGLLVDLKDIVPAGTYDVTVKSCTSANGAVYELPICQTAHCMAINKDVFEAAGAMQYIDETTHTWSTENFIKAVEAVSAYGQDPVGLIYCGGQGGDQGTRALVTNLYGGSFANAEHTQYIANSAENAKALDMLYNLKGIEFDPAIAATEEIQYFCNGTTAMAFCWNATQEVNNADKLAFDVFPMAFPTDSGNPVLQGGIWGFGVFDNGDQARIDAAKSFIQFMTGDDAQYAKVVEATNFGATRDIDGLYAGNELMEEYNLFTPYMGDYYQITLGWTEARTAWWNELQNIGSGAKTAQQALDDFVSTANAAAAAAG